MAIQISPLGSFRKLPYELRLLVWEYIFCIEVHGLLAKEQLGILRTNRAIHDEITSLKYDTLEFHITPDVDEGLVILPRLLARGQHRSPVVYKGHTLRKIPFEKVNIAIRLYAPDPQDPGQLLVMYRKMDKLRIHFDEYRLAKKDITIFYHKYEGTDWHCDGEPNASIHYPGKRRWLDREIVLIPFIRVDNVKSLQIIPSGRRMARGVRHGFIEYARDYLLRSERFFPRNNSIYRDDPKYATLTRIFNESFALQTDMKFFLDTKLDDIPGYTSDMLRLARFAEWFYDGTGFGSRYCDRILWILRWHHSTAIKFDHGLEKLLNRFKIMSKIYIEVVTRDRWDHRVLYDLWPDGCPPLSQTDRVEEELLIVPWQGYLHTDLLDPALSWFYISFMEWRAIRWPTSYRHPTLYGWDEEKWEYVCERCREVGFQYWCDECDDLTQESAMERGPWW